LQKLNENAAVAQISELFALTQGFSPESARQIKVAALLHDIGKESVPISIVNKPDKLTPAEYAMMKFHTKLGAQMLSGIPGELGVIVKTTCEFHHEWHNGGGYWGVPTSELPAYVPIIAIADVFVACCSRRPYKEPWPPDQVLRHIKSLEGTQFAPDVVDAFIHFINHGENMKGMFADENGGVSMWP